MGLENDQNYISVFLRDLKLNVDPKDWNSMNYFSTFRSFLYVILFHIIEGFNTETSKHINR